MHSFLGAVQFLTRVPVRLRTAPDLARSAAWFPMVGALIGASIGLVAAGLSELVPANVAAAVAVLVGVALTGAFHEDGLADTADAMGGWTPERRREILKDSRHGSYGVAAMCGSILLRVVCVAALAPAAAFAGLVVAHTLGRAAAVGVMAGARPTGAPGLGADYARSLRPARAAGSIAAAVGVAALAGGWWAVPTAAAVAVAGALLAGVLVRAFDGISGDHLGAVEQIGECVALVMVSGLAASHALWWS